MVGRDRFDYYGSIIDSCRPAKPGALCVICSEEAELHYRGGSFCEGCLLASKFLRPVSSESLEAVKKTFIGITTCSDGQHDAYLTGCVLGYDYRCRRCGIVRYFDVDPPEWATEDSCRNQENAGYPLNESYQYVGQHPLGGGHMTAEQLSQTGRKERFIRSLMAAAMNAALCRMGDLENWRQFVLLNAGHALSLARWGRESTSHLFDAIYYLGAQMYGDAEFHFECAADEETQS